MSDAMRIVPEEELTDEERAYAAERGLLRKAHETHAGGNQLTLEQMRALVVQGDFMIESASRYTAQRKREQAEAAAEAARVKADAEQAEAEERAETFKRQKLADWLAGGYGTSAQFEGEWPELRRALFAQQQQTGDDNAAVLLAKKRRELAGL